MTDKPYRGQYTEAELVQWLRKTPLYEGNGEAIDERDILGVLDAKNEEIAELRAEALAAGRALVELAVDRDGLLRELRAAQAWCGDLHGELSTFADRINELTAVREADLIAVDRLREALRDSEAELAKARADD